MGVGAGLYMYDVVAISSPDEFLYLLPKAIHEVCCT